LAGLKSAFRRDGTITAGSASQISDGAAAVVVMNKDKARELGLSWLVEIGAHGVVAGPDSTLQSQPANAIKKALDREGISVDQLDVVEINEAFAAQIVPCKEDLGIDDEKLNPFGGAIALGHPFGMTGARIMTTLINGLETMDGTYGIESMCVAGGMGMAMLVERLK
jgi:acetyl-CoA C-acetyltransferase